MKVRTRKSKLVTITFETELEMDILRGIINDASLIGISAKSKIKPEAIFEFLKHLDNSINES